MDADNGNRNATDQPTMETQLRRLPSFSFEIEAAVPYAMAVCFVHAHSETTKFDLPKIVATIDNDTSGLAEAH
ncbi:hypothetical protein [Rhizobium sp. ZPR3]|uniref:Uncharacterized protein n=2 Tax=unclassified Rhizobium TaxID=2613769 RepID=A0AAU7SMN1_9HYPH